MHEFGRQSRVPQVALFYLGVGLMAAEFPVVCRWPEPSLLPGAAAFGFKAGVLTPEPLQPHRVDPSHAAPMWVADRRKGRSLTAVSQ